MQSILLQLRNNNSINYLSIVLIIFFSCASFAQETESNNSLSLLKPGDKAPINSLKDTSDIEHKFPIENKWNLVFYWSLFCHSCIEEMPEIQSGLESLAGKDFSTFFVSLDTEKMQKALINFKKKFTRA